MNSPFMSNSTSATLRILADQIDAETAPDFCFAISNGDTFSHAHKSEDDCFGLIGVIELEKLEIISEIE